jgi:hypothetical protein
VTCLALDTRIPVQPLYSPRIPILLIDSVMTSMNGTYIDCGYGKDFSIVIACTGPGCEALQTFPVLQCNNNTADTGMQCSNGVTCAGATNYTSLFSLTQSEQPNQNLSLVQNITIGDRQFILTDDGRGNASYVNVSASTTSGSAPKSGTSSQRSSLSKLFLCVVIIMNVLVGPAAAALCIPGLSNLISELPPFFTNYVEGKAQELCEGKGNAIAVAVTVGETEFNLAIADLTVDCMEIMSSGELPAILADPIIAAALEIGNLIICSKLSEAILFGAVERGVSLGCSAAVSALANSGCTQSTTTTTSSSSSSSTTSSSSMTASTSTSAGSGPALPTGAALAADPCASCQLSGYYLGVLGLATQCGVASPVFLADDLSVFFCDPSIQPMFPQLCSDLCASPCSTYDIAVWKQNAGSGFMAGASLASCSQLCPGFAGTGRCAGVPPCNICGKGSDTCLPC